MSEENVINIISNIGVPSAIAFYVLVKVNNNLQALTRAVDRLSYTLQKSR